MKTLKTLSICVALVAITQCSAVKADNLFSSTGNQNVYQNTPVTQASGNSLTNAELPQFIQAMGYKVRDLGDNFFAISVQEGEWTFEPVISMSKGGTRLWIHTNLKTYPSSNSLSSTQLINLLDANLTYGPVTFNYNKKSNRISVSRSCKNQGLMPSELKAVIVDMCKVAVETESLWNIGSTNSQTQQTPVPQQTQKPNQPYWLKNVSK